MSRRIKLADLPPAYQAQVRLSLAAKTPPLADTLPAAPARSPRGPNKTEAAYCRDMLGGRDARYEAVSFRLPGGLRYTPDWVVVEDGRIAECHEVKGAYRFHSEGRARLAFETARETWPGIRWVWARKERGGRWKVEERTKNDMNNSERRDYE